VRMLTAEKIEHLPLRRGHANLLCIVPILVYVPPKRVRYYKRVTVPLTNGHHVVLRSGTTQRETVFTHYINVLKTTGNICLQFSWDKYDLSLVIKKFYSGYCSYYLLIKTILHNVIPIGLGLKHNKTTHLIDIRQMAPHAKYFSAALCSKAAVDILVVKIIQQTRIFTCRTQSCSWAYL